VILSLVIYLMLSIAGLTLVKVGSNLQGGISLGVVDGAFHLSLSLYSIAGFLCYVASFLIYMNLIQNNNLTYIVPIASGLTYILAVLSGLFFLHEMVTLLQWGGIAVILIGIVMMNI